MSHFAPRRSAILVMHPDPLLRAGLAATLCQHAIFDTFVDGIHDVLSDRRRIDVVITDYDHAMHLASAVHPAHDALAAARILVLTANDRETDIRRAIEAGVQGYIALGGPLDELIEGAAAVANGLRYVSRSVAQRMAEGLSQTALTSREMEVLSLVVAGARNKTIARELRIELNTVKSHMTAIMTKLGAASRTQAAGIATARGLVEQRALMRRLPAQPPAEVPKSRAQFA